MSIQSAFRWQSILGHTPPLPGKSDTGPGLLAVRVLQALLGAAALLLPGVATAQDLPVKDGLMVWLKADAVNTSDPTQVRTSGADVFVKQWNDQSGFNRHASNGTDNDQPLYVPGALNGLPALRFAQDSDDNGDRLYLGDLGAHAANAGTVFAVATIDNDGRYNLFGNRSNDERWVADTWSESQPGSFRNVRVAMTQSSWPTTGSHVFALESDSALFRILIDGSEIGAASGYYHSGSGANWTIGNRSTSGQQLRGDIAEMIIYNHTLTAEEASKVGYYLATKYGITTAYSDTAVTPQAKMYDLSLPGNPGIINGNDITITVPFRTDVTALAPTYMLSTGATCDKASGSAHNFTTPQTYAVVSSDLATTNVYTVTVHVRPPTVTYDFSSGLQGWARIWPPSSASEALWQNGALGSGYDNDDAYSRFARSPEFILHGLEDLTFQLAGGHSPTDTPPAPSAVPQFAIDRSVGTGYAGVALRDVATDTYVLYRGRSGDGDDWQTVAFTTAELAPFAIPGKKYTLDYMDCNRGSWGWTYMDNVSIPGYGTRVTLEATDPVISLGIPGSILTAALKIPEGFNQTAAVTVYVTNGNPAAVTINGSSATAVPVIFPAGGAFSQNLTIAPVAVGAALLTAHTTGLDDAALTVTVSPSLIGRWISGAANLAEDSGYRPAGTHDGVAVGTPTNLTFSSEVPPGCTGQSLDLRAGGVGVMVNNSSTTDGGYLNTYDDVIRNKFTVAFWAKGFPGGWNGWVSKRGESGIGWQLRRMSSDPIAGFTIRGVDNEDGLGSPINVNDLNWHHYAGVWDQATGTRKLYVDGVFSHTVNNTIGQMMNMATAKHLALGAREQGGTGFESYFAGLLFDVRIYSYPLSQTEIRALIPPALKLTGRSAVRVGASTPLTVTIPTGANDSAAVTVYLTNSNPSRVDVGGSPAAVIPITFAVGASTSQTLTLNGLSAGADPFSAGAAGMASASLAVEAYTAGAPGLIGHWVAGSPHLADISGFTEGIHDGAFIGAPPAGNFTHDLPLGRSGMALDLRGAPNTAVRINNSRDTDAGYLGTFDDGISGSQFSVAFWAKGFPDTWNPWVAKYGESGRGWQLRRNGGNPVACLTVRGQPDEDGNGSTINVSDNNWHHFLGVWDGVNGNRSLYVDGVLSHTITGQYVPMSAAPAAYMALGARGGEDGGFGNWFKGLLYDVRMYNTALTAGDALDLVGAILATPSSLSLFSPSPNTNLVTIVVPPGVVAANDVNIVVTSDKPGVAIPEGAVNGVRTITLPKGGANTTTFAVQANAAGTARFTYSCTLLPAMGATTIAVQQPNIGGLVAYWNFDNQTLAETSGFQTAGTHDGVAVGNVAYAPGRLGGYAADLRAASTAIRIKNSTVSDADYRTTFDAFMFNSPAGFSWSAWVKGAPISDWYSWIAKDGEAAGFAIRKAGGSQVTFTLRNSDGLDDPTDAGGVITDNLWHHLAAVYDPVTLQRRLYIDGVERINIADGNLTASATAMPLYFGARDSSSGDPRFARVIVDEIRAYDKVLTPTEIVAEVGAPMISLTPNVVNQNLDDPDAIATITVPSTMVATSAVTVTLTSANPAVATLVGATAGSLVVNFPMGGANAATVVVHGAGVGSTVITGTSPSGMINGEIAVTLTATPVLLGHWVSGAQDLVERSGYRPAGTHDGVAVGNNAVALGYSTDLPPNFTTGMSLDLTVGDVAVQVANSSTRDGLGYQPTFDGDIAGKFTVAFWAKGMPGEWNGWVTKYGEGGRGWQLRRMGTDNIAGFTLRGVDNDDGWGSGINVNDGNWHHFVGIWDQASGTRRLYVDGHYSHTVYNNPAQVMSQAPGAHLLFGGRQDESGNNSAWVSCLLFDVRIYSNAVSDYKIQSMLTEQIQVVLPPLTIQPWTGGQVRISWPTSFTDFGIEQSSALASGWGPSGLTVTVEGNENVAYAPATASPQFFRLKK